MAGDQNQEFVENDSILKAISYFTNYRNHNNNIVVYFVIGPPQSSRQNLIPRHSIII